MFKVSEKTDSKQKMDIILENGMSSNQNSVMAMHVYNLSFVYKTEVFF